MKIMTVRDDFYCAALGKSDFNFFWAAHELCWNHDRTTEEWWKIWREDNLKSFVLFKYQPDKQRDRIVGMGDLRFAPFTPFFQAGAIVEEFQGDHLIDLVYEARLKYTLEFTDYEEVWLEIEPDNEASMHVAERNGFECISDAYYKPLVPHLHVYRRYLHDLRSVESLDLELVRA